MNVINEPLNFIPTCYLLLFYKSFSNFIFNSSKPNGRVATSITKLLKSFESIFICLY